MDEVWKPVVGYEGLYEVSNLGSIRGVKRGKLLKPGKGKYLFVVLCKDGIRHETSVHRIVATAFCPNPDNKPEVNHINEIKTDNRAENLEWCTRVENLMWGTGARRRAMSQVNHPSKSKQIEQFSLDGKSVRVFPSTHEMERLTGFDRAAVYRAITGKRPTAYGYKWRFANTDNSARECAL